MNETPIKIKDEWKYFYRAVGKEGQAIEIRPIKYLNNLIEQDLMDHQGNCCKSHDAEYFAG